MENSVPRTLSQQLIFLDYAEDWESMFFWEAGNKVQINHISKDRNRLFIDEVLKTQTTQELNLMDFMSLVRI